MKLARQGRSGTFYDSFWFLNINVCFVGMDDLLRFIANMLYMFESIGSP